MSLLKEIESMDDITDEEVHLFLRLLAPFAPHLAEHMWELTGNVHSIHTKPWPQFDMSILASSHMTIVVQVGGKRRAEIKVPADATQEYIQEKALSNEAVQKFVEGATPARVVYVPGRLINIVL